MSTELLLALAAVTTGETLAVVIVVLWLYANFQAKDIETRGQIRSLQNTVSVLAKAARGDVNVGGNIVNSTGEMDVG